MKKLLINLVFLCYYCTIDLKGSRNIQFFALVREVLFCYKIVSILSDAHVKIAPQLDFLDGIQFLVSPAKLQNILAIHFSN